MHQVDPRYAIVKGHDYYWRHKQRKKEELVLAKIKNKTAEIRHDRSVLQILQDAAGKIQRITNGRSGSQEDDTTSQLLDAGK